MKLVLLQSDQKTTTRARVFAKGRDRCRADTGPQMPDDANRRHMTVQRQQKKTGKEHTKSSGIGVELLCS